MKDIQLPWHPESEKPTLPFVICTNGEGHYWVGRYQFANDGLLLPNPPQRKGSWEISGYDRWEYRAAIPLAWIEPEKFVPFVKKNIIKRWRKLDNLDMAVGDPEGDYILVKDAPGLEDILKKL